MAGDLVIPERLATSVVAWEGESGRAWLARLPRLVAELEAEWDLEIGPPFQPGGNISWTAPVRRRDGLEAVLKVQHPHPESAPEAAGLHAWGGNGAVLLHDHDPERAALLIERCAPGTALIDEGGTDDAVRAGARLGARLHETAAPPGSVLLADVMDAWARELEGRIARHEPADRGLADDALATMRTRPRQCNVRALLHGDLNPTNVLRAAREPWLAIDPKPMVGDPAYDGPRLVTQPDPLAAPSPLACVARRIELVVEHMELSRDALLAWCLVDSVEMAASARSWGGHVEAERKDEHVRLLGRLL